MLREFDKTNLNRLIREIAEVNSSSGGDVPVSELLYEYRVKHRLNDEEFGYMRDELMRLCPSYRGN